MKKLLLGLLLVAVTSVVKSNNMTSSDGSTLANLVDYKLIDGYMTIKVLTEGCTGVNSFKILSDSQSDNGIKVLRVKPDQCGMKPRVIELQYSIRHLGININQSVNLLNQLHQ